jgi:ATP-dependent Clp protease ATP-binding subunit ClpB
MRVDKLTTKFREALQEAQSLALACDHAYIEPQHLVLSMLDQPDGPRPLLERAGVQVTALRQAANELLGKLPQVQGQEQVQVGRDLVGLMQAAEKEGIKRDDAFIASELFFLALCDHKGDMAQAARQAGLQRKALEAAVQAVRGGQKVDHPEAEGQREALKKYTLDLTERARIGKLDPVIGRDDEIRRGPGPAHRRWRGARLPQGQAGALPRSGGPARGRQVSWRV